MPATRAGHDPARSDPAGRVGAASAAAQERRVGHPSRHPGPRTCKALSDEQLPQLCEEIRETIIETVAETGRPPGQLAGRGGAVGGAPPAAGQPDRPHRLGHRPPGVRPQAADRTGSTASARCASWAAWVASRVARESAHDVFDGGHAGTGISIGGGPGAGARRARHRRADRGRGGRRGAHERACRSRPSTTSGSAGRGCSSCSTTTR